MEPSSFGINNFCKTASATLSGAPFTNSWAACIAFSTARAILEMSKDTTEPSRLMIDEIFLDLWVETDFFMTWYVIGYYFYNYLYITKPINWFLLPRVASGVVGSVNFNFTYASISSRDI